MDGGKYPSEKMQKLGREEGKKHISFVFLILNIKYRKLMKETAKIRN